jgi:hypothetical protein
MALWRDHVNSLYGTLEGPGAYYRDIYIQTALGMSDSVFPLSYLIYLFVHTLTFGQSRDEKDTADLCCIA